MEFRRGFLRRATLRLRAEVLARAAEREARAAAAAAEEARHDLEKQRAFDARFDLAEADECDKEGWVFHDARDDERASEYFAKARALRERAEDTRQGVHDAQLQAVPAFGGGS